MAALLMDQTQRSRAPALCEVSVGRDLVWWSVFGRNIPGADTRLLRWRFVTRSAKQSRIKEFRNLEPALRDSTTPYLWRYLSAQGVYMFK